ncbi:MAG: putative metal-binding motif-containing protein [Myxococcota bacterium]
MSISLRDCDAKRPWLSFTLLLVAGCNGGTVDTGGPTPPADTDHDGYTTQVDCDDANAAVHPGMAEVCGDTIDQDCSGSDLVCGTETPTSIAEVAAAWAAEAFLSGTVYYYCDCGTGAEGDCVPGDDGNVGTDPLLPRRTIGDAESRFSTLALNDTVALCKGGAFNATGQLFIGSNRCGAGVACNDLREYAPTTFVGIAKPTINKPAGAAQLFNFSGNTGGVRLLNLSLKGSDNNKGFFFYDGAHDVTIGNLDMDGFSMAVYNESGGAPEAPTTNIKLTGSKITNSSVMGYLGGGMNTDVSYNFWDGNGSSSVFDHTIYMSGHKPLSNVRIVGNYIHGQYGPTCLGAPLVSHMEVDGLLVADNVVEIDAAASTGGCWGIDFDKGGNPEAMYIRNGKFSGNIIRNGGNVSLTVANCPDCVIENNLILQDWPYQYEMVGIAVPSVAARAGVDDVNTRNIIRNNTIWYGPNVQHGGTGIRVQTEGTGHIIANNTVYYSSTSGGILSCYNYPLASTAYAFINNNHCYSASANYEWVPGQSLASWRTAAPGFDTESITGDPLFTAAGTDFTLGPGSPLIGAGTAAYGSALDITGTTRPSPPAIGAYEP